MSNTTKWVIAAICAVLGVIALIYAVIYLAVPIHSLPGFVPGKKATTGPLSQAGLLSAVIGIVLLAIVVYLGMTSPTLHSCRVSGRGQLRQVQPSQTRGGDGGSHAVAA